MNAKQYIAYLQDANGNERTLKVTNPDPDDGTLCAHLDDDSWVRVVLQPTEMQELVAAYLKTLEIDESGDATLINFLSEQLPADPNEWNKDYEIPEEPTDAKLFRDFLVWANGPNWKEFLATAKRGDVPTK